MSVPVIPPDSPLKSGGLEALRKNLTESLWVVKWKEEEFKVKN